MQAGIEQLAGQRIVQVHHQLAVMLHGVAASALVEHSLHLAVCALGKARVELLQVHVIGDAQITQVAEFGAIAQIIDGDDVVDSALVQRAHQIAADEAGGAGDDDGAHPNNSS